MLTQEEDVDVHALRRRGMSTSAIARHLGRDRKTVRAYLSGDAPLGCGRRRGPDEFDRFVEYCRGRHRQRCHHVRRCDSNGRPHSLQRFAAPKLTLRAAPEEGPHEHT